MKANVAESHERCIVKWRPFPTKKSVASDEKKSNYYRESFASQRDLSARAFQNSEIESLTFRDEKADNVRERASSATVFFKDSEY